MASPKTFNTLYERVMSKVVVPPEQNENGCWIYTGSLCPAGYGSISVRVKGKRSPTRKRAHVVVWEEFHSPMPAGMTVDHLYPFTCERACCNIDHLDPKPVTRGDNARRATQRRQARDAAMQAQ